MAVHVKIVMSRDTFHKQRLA